MRRCAALADGLAWADFVSVHAPTGDRPLIGAAELAMHEADRDPREHLARGRRRRERLDRGAFATARLAAAGLDVFDDEPPSPDNPLLAMDQVVLSPHVAGLTAECAERMAVSSVQNVLDFFAGRIDPALVVNGGHVNG